MAGCYLVDYSYVEVREPQAGLRPRPAASTTSTATSRRRSGSIAETLSPRRIRLQRILFLTDLAGAVRAGTRSGTSRRTGSTTPRSSTTSSRRCTWQVARPPRHARALDPARDQSRRRAPLPVRGALDRGHAPIRSGRARTTRRSRAARPATWAASDYQALERTTRIMVYGRPRAGAGSSARTT